MAPVCGGLAGWQLVAGRRSWIVGGGRSSPVLAGSARPGC